MIYSAWREHLRRVTSSKRVDREKNLIARWKTYGDCVCSHTIDFDGLFFVSLGGFDVPHSSYTVQHDMYSISRKKSISSFQWFNFSNHSIFKPSSGWLKTDFFGFVVKMFSLHLFFYYFFFITAVNTVSVSSHHEVSWRVCDRGSEEERAEKLKRALRPIHSCRHKLVELWHFTFK